MLDHHAFQFERADAVVGRLEYVVIAADIKVVAVGVALGDVAGMVVAAAHGVRRLAVVAFIAQHQALRRCSEVDADLALRRRLAIDIEQRDDVARQRPAHGAGLDPLARRVADLGRGLRLAEAVADRQAPGTLDLTDDFRIERLAGADQFAQRHLERGQVFLDHHAPDRWRRAQRSHAAAADHVQHPLRVEAGVVVDEHRGARVPRREEAAPRMLGPARRADVPVHAAFFQAYPVHGGEVADRVALMAVQHQLGPGGGARGEIKQQRIGGQRLAVRRKGRRRVRRVGNVVPAVDAPAHRDAGVIARHAVELGGFGRLRHHMPYGAALQPVGQVVARHQHGGRHHDRAELDCGQHQLP